MYVTSSNISYRHMLKTAHIKKQEGSLAPAGVQLKAGLPAAAWEGRLSNPCIKHFTSFLKTYFSYISVREYQIKGREIALEGNSSFLFK